MVLVERLEPLQRVYLDAKGHETLRSGGSRSWRNNNPGNIRRGDFAINVGAIGDDGAFAFFPTRTPASARTSHCFARRASSVCSTR